MTPLNLALRCAALYTTVPDATKLTAVDATLFADALTAGLAEYWSRAPEYITGPHEVTDLTLANGVATVTLPDHFEQITRPPRIRLGATEAWQELIPTVEPLQPLGSGRPQWYRVQDTLVSSPAWPADGGGNTPGDTKIVVYPTPDANYELDLQCSYHAPVIRFDHLAGGATTINLPVPDDHLLTVVIPLCAKHFRRFKKRAPELTREYAAECWQAGSDALDAIATRRISGPVHYGTPRRW